MQSGHCSGRRPLSISARRRGLGGVNFSSSSVDCCSVAVMGPSDSHDDRTDSRRVMGLGRQGGREWRDIERVVEVSRTRG